MPHIKGHSGIHWHLEIEGEGEVLLFIHGWGVDKRIWRQQTKFFSQLYKVISIDLPGHGKSSWKKVSLAEMSNDLRFIFQYMNIGKMTIVGSSFGGMLALKLYEDMPDKVVKLIFVGSLPKFAKSDDFPYGLDIERMRKLSGQLESAYPSIVNIFFRSLFTIQERNSRRYKWLQKFKQTDDVPIKQALVEYLDLLEREDLRYILPNVRVPVQYINGREDQICNIGVVNYYKQFTPHARFDFFEDCGHFPFLSQPHEFNQIVEEFLEQNK